MTIKKSERLMVKFITNQASQDEIEQLTKWLEEDSNQLEFKHFIKTNYAVDSVMSNYDSTLLKKELLQKISVEKNIFYKSRISSLYKYAAILILVLGSLYFYNSTNLFRSSENVLTPKENEIVLQIGNESSESIDPSATRNITDKFGKVIGKIHNNRLTYSNVLRDGMLIYNTLRIPYGKRFEVQLSDGTIVHLNSGSSLTYPVQFAKSQKRSVYLVGEAFFEVSKDRKHPFTVNTQEVNVEVLGTKFNVNSYTEDISTDVVLVEGRISLYKGKKTAENQIYLNPGFKASSVSANSNISVEAVNTDYYTAWVGGSLVFKNASFESIIKKLERHYSITIINKNKVLAKEIFNARFDNEPIEAVLKYFSDSYSINYKIKGDTIIIE